MNNQGHYIATAVATAAGVLGSIYCIYKIYTKKKLPQKWRQVGILKELAAYPIKSCGGVFLTEGECTLMGLKDGWLRDRVLMVVDDKNHFITARVYPELLLIRTSVSNAVLTLQYKDMEPLYVNLAEVALSQNKVETAVVWAVNVPVWDCGTEAKKWFTRLINKPGCSFRLVYYASQNCREVKNKQFIHYNVTKNDTGAFPDEMSYHLVNQASVDELNTRMTEYKASARNFRPTFLITGAGPYDEDKWKFIKIGENIFEVIKPCTRCLLTTIDPETGVRHSKLEPLRTLKSYRQITDPVIRKTAGDSPVLGLMLSLRSTPGGIVRVNDPVFVDC